MVNHVNFIWNIAESLRGPFKPAEYGSVVLPFTVLRRLDAVLAETKPKVLNVAKTTELMPDMLRHLRLTETAGHQFYNTSPFDFSKLVADPQDLRANLSAYLAGFSENVRDIFERFEFDKTLNKLAEKNKLFAVTEILMKLWLLEQNHPHQFRDLVGTSADQRSQLLADWEADSEDVPAEIAAWANEPPKASDVVGDCCTSR
ncbi:type I restriction-modification system subunit M N-terminal domain-containing protein [Microbacterium sp. YMB-B2]|uniref:Type I restriction-modification system subunit M N-terminal domain-containing protein n=1 Tax=Microbacterium tenebrionis TaxID=2830665 RepID=A0A9X1LMG4_9MICO|nr:type I restriction-modification system subunit M N-terminal domain-containing protein [Microbacterium tenebrionis]MCC2028381.1 type I restriction-modification system subunit M N-terminal domain-containing protein [Microbacterium tenebrionis]